MGDAVVGGIDIAQKASQLARQLQGTALESSFKDRVLKMITRRESRVIMDLGEVLQHDPDMQRRILNAPRNEVPVWEKYAQIVASDENPEFMNMKLMGGTETEVRQLHVGFEGQLGTHLLNPRTLRSHHLNQLVAIDGIVTKVGLIRPKLEVVRQYCEATGSLERPKMYYDHTSLGNTPTSSVIVSKDAQNNPLTTEFGMCRFKNHQSVHLQEMPENAEVGTVPRAIEVLLDHDLVDCCKPGDRVRITGIYMAISQGQQGQSSGVFPTFVYGLNARSIGRTVTKVMPSQEDIKNIKTIAQRADVFEVLSRSLANSIHGHDTIKKGLLLLLLGGQEKNLASGTHLRGDINILLVGDPSTAKSQLLRFVLNTAPLAISTSGRGSTGVGLTAAVVQDRDTGERKLEAGAMVLADRGVVCIDEFDKMNDQDRVAIHEIMEQQTVTISKAGIHTSLNARCSVFAAANPVYGTYDKSRSATANIGLPDSILSRFDLLFVVLDSQTTERDRRIADHVLRSHRYREDASAGASLTRTDDANDTLLAATNVNSEPVTSPVWSNASGASRGTGAQGAAEDSTLTIEFMKKFIYYARTRTEPTLTPDARDAIAHAYADLRASSSSFGGRMSLPITPRTLETVIRLSTAYARCSLSKLITQAHVAEALKLLRSALLGEVEQERPQASEESDSDDSDDDDGGGATKRTPPRTPAKGGSAARTPKKTPRSGAAERTPTRSTRSSLADALPPGDTFEFRPEVDAPFETPGRRMRPSPRAAVSSPASGSRRPASSVLAETPSPAKRARGAAARGGAAASASPAKALPGPVSDVDFQDFKQKLARQFQSQRVEKLRFEDVYQMFQERYSEQDVRVSLAKMCAEGILFEDEGEDGSIHFHIL